ncbi:MAG: DNA-binding response OmpR family regulator [Chitinophagales bacterium]
MAFSKNGIKILVVEDTPGDVFLIKFYLEELDPDNYEIQSVDNLEEAHYKIEREAFDVILLDLHLPDSQGIVTLQNSVKKFPNDVFIVLTGLSDAKIGLEAVKYGAQDFLVKGRIDSKSLDSSIKFSFQRAKLKRAVKLYGEALKTLEVMYGMIIVIIDKSRSAVYTSLRFKSFFMIDEETVDTMEELMHVFENNQEILNAINSASDLKIDNFVATLRGQQYNFKVSKSKEFNDQTVISVSR